MLAPEEFDRLKAEAHFVDAVQGGLRGFGAARVVSDRDLALRLDARFGTLSKSAKKK